MNIRPFMPIIAVVVCAAALAVALPMRSAEESLGRIAGIIEREARNPAMKQRDYQTALAMLDRFHRDYPEPENRAAEAFYRSSCHAGLGDYPRALGLVDTALALPLADEHRPTAHYLRGSLRLETGARSEGVADFRSIIEKYPAHEVTPQARFMYAQLLAEDGRTAEAIATLDALLAASPPAWLVENARSLQGNLRRIGQPAPAVDGPALEGGTVSLSEYRGKIVLVDFWATWCAPCRDAMPDVRALYDRFHPRGFDIVGISLDRGRTELVDYVRLQGIPWRQVYEGRAWDSAVAARYGVTAIPKTFLLDRQGRIAGVDLRGPQLAAAVERLLGSPGSASGTSTGSRK